MDQELRKIAALAGYADEQNKKLAQATEELKKEIKRLSEMGNDVAEKVADRVDQKVSAHVENGLSLSALQRSVTALKTTIDEMKDTAEEAEFRARRAERLLTWRLTLLLLIVGAGFVGASYAVARYTMPNIPALLKEKADLERSIRVLSSHDPEKMDIHSCDGKPCVRVYPDTPYGSQGNIFVIKPVK